MSRMFPTLCLVLGAVPIVASAIRAEDYRKVLISTRQNVHVDDWELKSQDLDLATAAPWSVSKHVLHGGKQEGVDVVTINSGKLKITVVPTRGMSVLEVSSGDLRLGWDSPVKEVVHPKLINLQSRGGLGWLEGFNEWMVRCGLEYAGHPGTDSFIDNTGEQATMELTLHGKIGNVPASEVELIIDRQPPHRIRLRGVVYERLFHGPNLKLVAEVSTVAGSDSFRIDDTITNLGASPQEFQLIYHTNFGRPLLQAAAGLVAAAKNVAPMNDHAGQAVKSYDTYQGPTAGFIEEVFLIHPYADSDGRTMVLLHNAARDRGASIAWSTTQLPYLTVWKNTAAEAAGYVTGLEPGTCFPFNRGVERKAGRVPKLKPGQTRRFTLDFGLHEDRDAVSRVVNRIEAIRAGRSTRVDSQPPES